MKFAVAALFAVVAALFSATAQADSVIDGYVAHTEPVPVEFNGTLATAYQTTLTAPGHPEQVVWRGHGIVMVVTPKTIVVDDMVTAYGGWRHHETAAYHWNGQKFVVESIAGFSMFVDAVNQINDDHIITGQTFVTTLTFPGYPQGKVISGIVQDIHMGFLTVDHVFIGTDGTTTHEIVRLSMGHW